MKAKLFLLSLIFFFYSESNYSQCGGGPVTLPASDSSTGGIMCLEGIPNPDNNDICFENWEGNLNLILNGNYSNKLFTFFKNGDLKVGNIEESTYSNKFIIQGPNTPTYDGSKRDISFEFNAAGSSKIRSYRGTSWGTYLQFLTNPNNGSNDSPQIRMHINEDGNIGIGTITPKSKLEVIGNVIIGSIPQNKILPASAGYNLYVEKGIISEKVKVALLSSTQWSDYVFEEKYNLKPLEDVEKYIKENKHLPNIPSSKELVKEGLDLGEMQAKQMEKIEELTLYLIEMKKEINALKKENQELKEAITKN